MIVMYKSLKLDLGVIFLPDSDLVINVTVIIKAQLISFDICDPIITITGIGIHYTVHVLQTKPNQKHWDCPGRYSQLQEELWTSDFLCTPGRYNHCHHEKHVVHHKKTLSILTSQCSAQVSHCRDILLHFHLVTEGKEDQTLKFLTA